MSADHNVFDVVDDAAQLQSRRLRRRDLVRVVVGMGDDVACVSNDEHVADVHLRKPRGYHAAVDAGEEHGLWLK